MNTPNELKATKGTVIPPEGGWKQQTYYVVDIAWSAINVIHRAVLYVGFFGQNGNALSGNYTSILQGRDTYDEDGLSYSYATKAYYIKFVSELKEMNVR